MDEPSPSASEGVDLKPGSHSPGAQRSEHPGMSSFGSNPGESQLKFVVTGPDDLPEIEELIAELRSVSSATTRDSEVPLMPEGTTRDELDRNREIVAELATEHGYRYTPRIHVDLWNDAPQR